MRGYDVALKFLGYQEHTHRTQLMKFFRKHGIICDPSTTPWCAAFVDACEKEVGNKGTGRLNARSFLAYGDKVPVNEAQQGDIVIFTRGNNSWQGHVTYFDSYYGTELVRVLGGNQSDQVKYSYYPRSRIIGIRRP